MRDRPAWSVAAAAVAALALTLALTAPASAAPGDGGSLSPALLAAMQRDLGTGAAQARARVAREDAAARTDDALRSRLGGSVIGSWVDPATGVLTVRTTDETAVPVIQAAGARAAVSKKDPRKAKDKLDKAARKAARSVGAWYVDEQTGAVVVESTAPADARAFIAASDATADGVQVKQVTAAPSLFYNLVGGAAIRNSVGRCSIGFSARSGATAYVITAGHCTDLGGTWAGYNGVTIGRVASSHFPTDDYGSIRVNSTATWRPTGQVTGLPKVTGSTAAAVGASTCRSGSTSGVHCGTIQAKNATVNYGGGDIVYGLTRTNACAEPGDSGGSFTSGTQAQGMTSGGSGNCTSGGTTFFQPVAEALSVLRLTLVTT